MKRAAAPVRAGCSILVWAVVTTAGCDAPAATTPTATNIKTTPATKIKAPRRPSKTRMKEALFGDPALVPTREGEQARRELALAGSIEEHLAGDPNVGAVRVDVSAKPDRTPQVIISLHASGSPQALTERSQRVSRAILADPEATVTVDIVGDSALAQGSDAQPRPLLTLALVLALLALGASAGITLDRTRRRSSARRSPS